MGSSRRLLTPEFRMCYPKLIVPEAFKGEGGKKEVDAKPTYSTQCLVKPDALTKFLEDQEGNLAEVDVRHILVAVAKAEWPDINVKEAVASGELFWPLIDGDTHAAKLLKDAVEKKKERNVEHYLGMKMFTISANEDYPPVLSIREGGKKMDLNRISDVDMAKGKLAFKGGNYGLAEVSVAAMKIANKKYLKFYVNSVRMLRSGDPIGGGGSGLMGKFDGVSGGQSDKNPMAGLDDEIPF